MKNFLVVFITSILLLTVGGYFFVQKNKNEKEIVFKGEIEEKGEKILEPSGATFNKITGTLYVVSDEGFIFETSKDGEILRKNNLGRLDLEGVTFDYLNNKIFAVVEKKDQIIQISVDDFNIERIFEVERSYKGKEVLNPDRDGFEGLTIVPEEQVFYLVNQGFSLKEKYKNDAPAIIKVKLSDEENGRLPIDEYYPVEIDDLSEIVYLEKEDKLLVVSDSNNLLMRYNRNGKKEMEKFLAGEGKEGLAVDDDDLFYLFHEEGNINRFYLKNKND